MPLTRYQIRDEYGLADPELYRAADKDDPEALLEGVAMAGLVGILRQLGDLAEFAAEMFHDLHEEVMATAARGHGLMARVQQLEVEFPSIEKALLSRTDISAFFSNTGVDWHPNLKMEQGLITHGDLPHCVMDSYEECRGPPRLFLLDKFDVAGAGACLKRYTDPSFFRLETFSSEASMAEIHREKKSRKAKKRGLRRKNRGTPEIEATTHVKLHQLFLEERVEGGHTDPACLVKLKTRKLDGYPLIAKSGESYMEKFVRTYPDHKTAYENFDSDPPLLMWDMDDTRDLVTEIPEVSVVDVVEKSCQGTETEGSSPNKQDSVQNFDLVGEIIDRDIETVSESTPGDEKEKTASNIPVRIADNNMNGKPDCIQDRSYSEDLTCEVDNYVDALATMESETETDNESRPRKTPGFLNGGKHDPDSEVDEEQMDNPPRFSGSQSIGNSSASENGCSLLEKWRSSFSYSDTASISTDNDPCDREKTAGHIPSSDNCESRPVSLSSNITPSNKDIQGYDSHDHKSVSGGDFDFQASCSSRLTSLSQNDESHSLTDHSLAPESVETSDSSRLDLKKGGTDESVKNPVDSSTAGAPLDARELCFFSEASSTELPIPAPEGNIRMNAIEDAIQRNYVVEHSSENLANPGTGSKPSDDTPANEQLSCSAGLVTEVSPGDMVSRVGSPIRTAVVLTEITLDNEDNEVDNVIVTKAVPEVDSQGSVAELSGENSPACGTAADESVSEIHEDTLENRTLMPSEISESTLASNVSLEDKKSLIDASPNCNLHNEHLLDASVGCNSSYLDDGFGGHVGLDNVVPETLLEQDVAATNKSAATASEDVKCAGPSILTDTQQPSFVAGKLSHNVPESDGTHLIECNPESEIKMRTDRLEVPSEVLDSVSSDSLPDIPLSEEVSDIVHCSSPVMPNNNDLANGEPLVLQISLDQSNTGPDTKSPHRSNLLSTCVDSSVLNVGDLSESGTPLEQSIEVRARQANHVLADEATLHSDFGEDLSSEPVPEPAGLEPKSCKQAMNLEYTSPTFGLTPETVPPVLEEMPPLPPLPPLQWRIGKIQHSTPPAESVENSNTSFLPASPFGAGRIGQSRFAALDQDSVVPKDRSVDIISGVGKSDQLPEDNEKNADEQSPSASHTKSLTTATDLSVQYESCGSERTGSVNASVVFPAMLDGGLQQDLGSEEGRFVQSATASSAASTEHLVQSHDDDSSREMPLQPQNQLATSEDFEDETYILQNSGDSRHHPDNKALTATQSAKVEEEHQFVPWASNGETVESSNSMQKILPGTLGDAMWPVNAFALASTLDDEKPSENPTQTVKVPRPRSPLVDAVAAHDRRTMRKVSERVRPPIEPNEEEKNSLLAQIRNKSFSLKPASMTRSSMQIGPQTNLKVAAILEKANTIRQAMAGSDEDDDSDSWSDS